MLEPQGDHQHDQLSTGKVYLVFLGNFDPSFSKNKNIEEDKEI